MTQAERKFTVVNGKIIPKNPLSHEEKTKRKAEQEEFYRRCRIVFDKVQPELIKDHYDWFILIEPDSGDYFLDPDEEVAKQKATEKYPNTKCLIMRLNKTGACGKI